MDQLEQDIRRVIDASGASADAVYKTLTRLSGEYLYPAADALIERIAKRNAETNG